MSLLWWSQYARALLFLECYIRDWADDWSRLVLAEIQQATAVPEREGGAGPSAEVWVAQWAAQSAAVLLCAPRWSVLCLLVVLLSFPFLLFVSDSARVTHFKASYSLFSFSHLTRPLSHCFYTFARHTNIQPTPPDLRCLMSTS